MNNYAKKLNERRKDIYFQLQILQGFFFCDALSFDFYTKV